MNYSLEELTTPLTVAEVKQSIYDVIAALGTDHTSWRPGSPWRVMIAACAIVLAATTQLVARTVKGGYLSLASGSWLTLRAYHGFGVKRRAATFASGAVTITNEGPGVFEWGADELIALNPITGMTYANAEPTGTLGIGSTVTLPFRALEAGARSTSAAGAISALLKPEEGVSASNPGALVGLGDQQDPELKDLCTAKLGSLSTHGPKGAYVWAAMTATRALDGSAVGVTRVTSKPDGYGGVTVYCATASGAVTGDAADPSTDLGAVAANVTLLAESLAVTPTVVSAETLDVEITYDLWCYDDVDLSAAPPGLTPEARIAAEIELRLAAHIGRLPIGGATADTADTVFIDAIQTVIGSAFPQAYRTLLTSPAGDEPVAPNQAPSLSTVGGVVHLVRRSQ